jgi:hypothetical protein
MKRPIQYVRNVDGSIANATLLCDRILRLVEEDLVDEALPFEATA